MAVIAGARRIVVRYVCRQQVAVQLLVHSCEEIVLAAVYDYVESNSFSSFFDMK